MRAIFQRSRSLVFHWFALLIVAVASPAIRVEAANPVITSIFTADPAALVSGGKVYLYTGHDEGSTSYVMKDWRCFSSSDMVSWQSEGSPMALTAFSWALSDAWAGQVIERDGKFFYYVPMSHKTITGFAIGVGVSNSPTGPFVDARGTALITNDMTADGAGKTNVFSWDDIDPTVFIDDDGQAYLFWGNTVCHYVKLKSNMIETDGAIQTVTLPLFTEAPWVHKRNGLYYLSYAYGWEEKIAYATSTSIAGPWTFRGVINDYVTNCNTNHQSIIDFKGQSYFIYHNGAAAGGGSFRRSVCIDYLNYNADGSIIPVVQTTAGVSAVTSTAATTPTFANVTVHDPAVVRDGATYYVFGSHMASASSPDLMKWTQITTSAAYPNSLIRNQNPQTEFAATLAYAGNVNTFWAPDVIKLGDGKYYYYYCACQGSSPLSALGLARADSITGPYTDVGILLKSAGATPTVSPYNVNTMPNVVDPSVFFDNTGKLWMVYGSFSGGIFILQLDSTVGSPTIGQPLTGQGYGKKLMGGNSSRIEGACITYSPETSYYYLFCTFGGLDAVGGYNIRVGRSLNPDGPFLDAAGNDLTNVKGNFAFDDATIAPFGVKLMGNWQFLHVANDLLATSRGYVSPGGVSITREASTGKYLAVFHTRFVSRGEAHEVRTHQLYLNADGWFVAAPHCYAEEAMTTTSVGQIPGDYKLINHGKDITATVKTSTLIALNADGSVSGAAAGTWTLSGDHYATVTLAGTSYRGVFARQWDDDNQAWTLTFSALSTDGVAVWGSKVAALTTDVAPAFTTQPSSQAVAPGVAVTFTAAASGTPSPTFQWQKAGVNISGATSSSFSIASVSVGDAGSYSVIATNSAGSVTSNAATLTVSIVPVAPVIVTQPLSQTATTGNAVTFIAVISGAPSPTYQWYKNGGLLAGATNASYTISSVQLADGGTYSVVATNASGSATSTGAILTIYAWPTFTTQPLSQAAFVGSVVNISTAASGSPAPSYQWQKGGINLPGPGSTGSLLTISNVQLSAAGSYALVATNLAGSVTSRFARLVVLVPQQNAITYATTRSASGVTAGGIVNFDYFVTNVGTKTWGARHYLSIRDVNNTFVAFSSLIGILPGETTTANLNFPAPTTPGSYTYYVQGLEDGVEFFSTQTTVILNVLAPVTNAITYNTTTFPVSAAPGSNVIFTYNVTNTGTATWGASHILSLKNASGTVISSTPLTVLAPGASKTVNLSFTVPTAPGSYSYTVQASQTGVGNFGTQANLTLVALAPQPNAIVYNRVRYPDEVVPGAVLNLKYTLSNAGTQVWGAGHYVSLRDSASNYLAFIPLSGTAVSAAKTVEFTLTAPTTPGTYTYYIQALEDGVEFFSTQDVVIITVVALPLGNAISYNTSTMPVTAAPGATVNFTANVTNRGTRTWGATHYLSFRDVDNTFLAFPTLNGVAPGASRTSNLSFTAPTTPGIYTYTLQAFEDGVSFFEMADTVVLLVQ